MSKKYYLHNDKYNMESDTSLKVINEARKQYKISGLKSFIYFIDREKYEVGTVGWQFKIKDITTGKTFKNIYLDYMNCLTDYETLASKHPNHNFLIVNEFGEVW